MKKKINYILASNFDMTHSHQLKKPILCLAAVD